jgi:phosphomethylpyrimidine synthase
VTFKIAAHAADIARGFPGARDRDDQMSRARAALDWPAMFQLALDGDLAKKIRHRDDCPGNDYCSMCGRKWCAIRLNNELKTMLESEKGAGEK